MQIPNNQSGLASTSLAERHLPLDNYKNNILKAKSQDENKKVGGQAMLSFPAVLPTSSSAAVASIDDKSRYDCLYFSLSMDFLIDGQISSFYLDQPGAGLLKSRGPILRVTSLEKSLRLC